MVQGTEATRSQLIPVITKWEEIGKKAQLGPIIFCIVAFFALDSASTSPIMIRFYDGSGKLASPLDWVFTSQFLILVAFLLTAFSFYFIYRIVGKAKSWLMFLGAFAFTAYFIWLMKTENDFGWMWDFFHHTLAGEARGKEPTFFQWVVGTGFFEEIVKAIPVFILAIASTKMSPSMRARFGVEEPLDGILIGCAAAGGFAIAETLLQYLSDDLVRHWIREGILLKFQVSPGSLGAFFKANPRINPAEMLQIGMSVTDTTVAAPSLMIRSIDQAFGHMAYSGYFGYFIGLSVLKPEQRWKILGIGLVSASIPHALWDYIVGFDKAPLTAAVAVFSYAVLAAAILKAREISPNRAVLQPSVIFGYGAAPPTGAVPVAVKVNPVVMAAPGPNPAMSPAMAAFASGTIESNVGGGAGGNRLRVGTRFLVITAGLRLLEHQVPGVIAQSQGGPVAEVTRNPNDPSVLGLTNLSTSSWEVVTPSGTRRQILSGQTVKLALGTKIDFGPTDGEVS